MKTVHIRPRYTAFQWDGSEVEGFRQEGGDIVREHVDGTVSYAKRGDWIVTRSDGHSWVCPNATFAETYEVVDG